MRRIIFSLILVIFLTSLVSAELIITQQTKEVYNLGDIISIPVTVKSLTELSGTLQMDLICNGITKTFYMNGIGLSAGEEKRIESQLVLSKVIIGELAGDCKIKVLLNTEYILTNDFRISNLMSVSLKGNQTELAPGEQLVVKGNAVKENANGANGFINLEILDGNNSLLTQLETIKEGYFMINITLPEGLKAGNYLVKLKADEKDSNGLTTNSGGLDFDIVIKQVPSNLELVFDSAEIEPGTSVKVRAILHDQTGSNIASTVFVSIKNKDGIIMQQVEKPTEEVVEYPILYNEKPYSWTVVAVSNRLTAESNFTIKEKEAVDIQLINKTVVVKNIGNVPYNKTVLVKVGDESLDISVSLLVDEEKKYSLTAPNGEYEVEVLTEEGNTITGMVTLTGREVAVREAEGGLKETLRKPFIWITLILILGFVASLIFRKVRKKSFFGFIFPRRNKKPAVQLKEGLNINEQKNNIAELSLSIKGDKQDVSVVCLGIKNLREMKAREDVRNSLRKVEELANEQKAVKYESQDAIFFLLVPLRTRTFRNEQTALQIAQGIKEILTDHNKLFKNRIDFGISLNHGTIIAKQEGTLKFMTLGTLTTISKKIASLSKGDVLLSDKMNERIQRFAKTQRQIIDDVPIYSIREMKATEEYKKFIDNFLRKLEKKED